MALLEKSQRFCPLYAVDMCLFEGFTEVALALLEMCADMHAKDFNGRTALHYACQYGRAKLAIALLKKDVDVNVKDNGGDTP